ncbi:MAG: prenyltransferase [Candidatus Omnitrophica bacterium]|nr:prenyltransferase [Candidatus Omnitrophota bacterium]
MAKIIIRALRLPFITASILPFVFGSLIERSNFNYFCFFLGLVSVICTHLSANLINDYADSKSGADWKDKNFYGLFGGSKLIQEGLLSEKFYLNLSIVFAVVAFLSVIILAIALNSLFVVFIYLTIIFLSWSYSHKPFQFSYCGLGEIFLFLLFGPALVMGGYFIQTGIFPDLKSFILSAPFGLFTTAILFANEIPDYPQDKAARKFTWVSVSGPRKAFILYYLLMFLGLASIVLGFFLGYLKAFSLLSLLAAVIVLKAGRIIKKHYTEKMELVKSSRMTIALQSIISIILIVGLFL